MHGDEDEGEAWWRISRAVAKAIAWCLVGRADRDCTVIKDDNQFGQRAGSTTRDEMRWIGGGTVVPALLTTVHQPY